MVNDLSKLELLYKIANTSFTHHPALEHLKPVSILGATYPSISGNNPDPDVASPFFKGADMHYPSESSQLKAFLDDLEVYIPLNED